MSIDCFCEYLNGFIRGFFLYTISDQIWKLAKQMIPDVLL